MNIDANVNNEHDKSLYIFHKCTPKAQKQNKKQQCLGLCFQKKNPQTISIGNKKPK